MYVGIHIELYVYVGIHIYFSFGGTRTPQLAYAREVYVSCAYLT